jgi:hypothetical protein
MNKRIQTVFQWNTQHSGLPDAGMLSSWQVSVTPVKNYIRDSFKAYGFQQEHICG